MPDSLPGRASDTFRDDRYAHGTKRPSKWEPSAYWPSLPVLRLSRTALVPPVPDFYTQPKMIDDIVDQTIGRALDVF
jgi:hypothetical protein